MFDTERNGISKQIQAFCAANHLADPTPIEWKPIPFAGDWGIAMNFFQIAAQEARQGNAKGPVPQRAQALAEMAKEYLAIPKGFSRVEAIKGFLNLYYAPGEFSQRVVDQVLQDGKEYGRGAPKSETVMVEYAQPNTHHSFHIGHARNAILGEAVARLVEFAGYPTIRASYPGDIGLGVITVVWAYRKFYLGQEPQGVHARGQWLLKIYAEATRLLEAQADETPEQKAQREAFELERREIYRRWDAGDPEIRQLWLTTRQWSLDELHEVLKLLDIDIRVWFFESEADEPAKEIVQELIARGIADDERPDGGAVIVKIDEKLGLTKEKYRTNVVLRNDGTTLYLTKDLALAKIKFEQYHVDRSLYVVDVRQSMHLQQAFKILELMGYPQAPKCYHLGYGFVSLPEGAMSARRGRVVLFKDVADEAYRRVLAVIAQKNPDLPMNVQQVVAQQVGLGALAYSMLSVDNSKDMIFDWDSALSFDGHTAPYIQYSHVRCNSILRKAQAEGISPDEPVVFDYAMEPTEIQLVDLIARLPDEVQRAAAEYRPLPIANLAYETARALNDFYNTCPVLKAEPNVRSARLRLVAAARQALANLLWLLVIKAPEAM